MRMRGGPGGRWRMGGPLPLSRMMRGLPLPTQLRDLPLRPGRMPLGGCWRWLMALPLIVFGTLCCAGFVLARAIDTGDFRCVLLPFCCLGGTVVVIGLGGVLAYMFFQELTGDDDEEKAKNTIDGEIV